MKLLVTCTSAIYVCSYSVHNILNPLDFRCLHMPLHISPHASSHVSTCLLTFLHMPLHISPHAHSDFSTCTFTCPYMPDQLKTTPCFTHTHLQQGFQGDIPPGYQHLVLVHAQDHPVTRETDATFQHS